jgi:hypothetical protein
MRSRCLLPLVLLAASVTGYACPPENESMASLEAEGIGVHRP